MIKSSLGFFTFMFIMMAIVFVVCDRVGKTKKGAKVMDILPPIVWIFLLMSLAATFGIFDLNAEGVIAAQNFQYSTFLPLMLVMFMLTCDVKKIIHLGPRMIGAFLIASLCIMIGFTVAFIICKGFLPENAWAIIASVTGSFIGETVNMVAVAGVFGVEGVDYAYAVMMVTYGFTIFLTVIMILLKRKEKWNKFMNASTDGLDEIAKRIESEADPNANTCVMLDYMVLFAICLGATWLINTVVDNMPTLSFINGTGLRVVFSSIIGVILSLTRVRKLRGATQVANVFLYLSLCVTASYSDLKQCTQAPGFLVLVTIMLVVMFLLWVLFSKLFKYDLFTAEVSITANIGGTSSAPLIAAAHNPNWISFGILLGFFGDIVGTWLAIGFGHFLHFLS